MPLLEKNTEAELKQRLGEITYEANQAQDARKEKSDAARVLNDEAEALLKSLNMMNSEATMIRDELKRRETLPA